MVGEEPWSGDGGSGAVGDRDRSEAAGPWILPRQPKEIDVRTISALAVAVAVSLSGTGAAGQELVVAPRIEVGLRWSEDGSDFTTLRVGGVDERLTVLAVGSNGDVVFSHSATVDFSGSGFRKTAGRRSGYVVVYVGGRPQLVPTYDLPRELPVEPSESPCTAAPAPDRR